MKTCKALYPALFVNHGGGPLPLLGRQENISQHLKEVVQKYLQQQSRNTNDRSGNLKKPEAIVVISAHWESDPIQITSSSNPKMLFDYYGFPPQTYQYKYPAKGDPKLAMRIKELLQDEAGLDSQLNDQRGYDHGVFVPLMLMYPEADIPVVCVSLHKSLNPETNIAIGKALRPLREDGILILGSGYTFHNMEAFFHPSKATHTASLKFNQWLKQTIVGKQQQDDSSSLLEELKDWENAPGARICHPREEHLMPLLVVAGASYRNEGAQIVYDNTSNLDDHDHAISSYFFGI